MEVSKGNNFINLAIFFVRQSENKKWNLEGLLERKIKTKIVIGVGTNDLC